MDTRIPRHAPLPIAALAALGLLSRTRPLARPARELRSAAETRRRVDAAAAKRARRRARNLNQGGNA